MENIYITNSYYSLFAQQQLKTPRERFVKYYQDLYRLYGGRPNETSFYEGLQYTYSELGASVLDLCERNQVFNHLDLFICAYWSYEFDPEHASCGAYFSERYKINCTLFDICDQGTLSPFTALHVLTKYFNDRNFRKALLLVLEQTTIPRDKSTSYIIPSSEAAIAFVIEKEKNTQLNKKLLAIEIFSKKAITDTHCGLLNFIKEKCHRFSIASKDLLIVLRNAGDLWLVYLDELKQGANFY